MSFKRVVSTALQAVLVLAIFTNCRISHRRNNNNSQVIVPESAGVSKQVTQTQGSNNEGFSTIAVNKIGLDYKILGHQVMDIDNNQDFEELYFVRNNNDSDNALLEIMVFDIENDNYVLTSTVLLGSDNSNSLSVTLLDINGDGQNDLICQGFANDGRQVLDIFRINNPNVVLTPMLNLAIKGSIEIRNDQTLMDDTISYAGHAVIVHRDNPDTPADPIDLIKEIYVWQSLTRTFQIEKTEVIQSETISKEKIQTIFYGNEDVFIQFLAGSWLKVDPVSNSIIETVYFSPIEKSIYFFNGEILESYNWNNSRKVIHNRLYIESENSQIESLKCSFYITAENFDKISISINGVFSDMNGSYVRINIPVEQFKPKGTDTSLAIKPENLLGLFKGNQGFDLLFQLPKISILSGSNQINAVGTIYSIHGINVLEWQFPDNAGNALKLQQVYQIKYSTRTDSGHQIKTLIMEPIALNADRFIPLNSPSIHLEQITLEKESEN